MKEFCVILVTAANLEEGRAIGRALVEEKLVACANLVPEITSFFIWEGKLSEERETLLILKAPASQYPRIEARVKELHSYQVPEVIALPIAEGSPDYLKWVGSSAPGAPAK